MEEEKNEEINLELESNFVINETYTILLDRKIGSGSFGQIYQCLNFCSFNLLIIFILLMWMRVITNLQALLDLIY